MLTIWKFARYRAKYGVPIGGRAYDITKMTEADRKKYSLLEPPAPPKPAAGTKDVGDPKRFMTVCQPSWDRESEDESDEEGEGNQCDFGETCFCRKLATQNPEHIWVFSSAGIKAYQNFMIEKDNRNPNEFDMYMYNDYKGHGLREVLQNQASRDRYLYCFVRGKLTF